MTGARRRITVGLAAATLGLVALAAAGEPRAVGGRRERRMALRTSTLRQPERLELRATRATRRTRTRANRRARRPRCSSSPRSSLWLPSPHWSAAPCCVGPGASTGDGRRPSFPAHPAAPSPDLADAVEEGLVTLEVGAVDDAVIACWVRLEEAAAAGGVDRLPWETATELTVRLFDHFDVPEPAVDRLLGLYRTARYSRSPPRRGRPCSCGRLPAGDRGGDGANGDVRKSSSATSSRPP